MDYNKILLDIGEFGRWQRHAIFCLIFPAFVGGLVVLTTVFTARIPGRFQCYENATCLIPEEMHQLNESQFCWMYSIEDNETCSINSNINCDSQMDYYYHLNDYMKTTIITDNKIQCDDWVKAYSAICHTFFMVGYLFGGIIFGSIADTFGRRVSLSISIFANFIGSGFGPLLTNHWAYAVTRIIPGAGSIGCYLMSYTLAVEIIGKVEQVPKFPWNMTIFALVGNMIAIPFAMGEASNGLFAFMSGEWRVFQGIVTFICGVSIISMFFVPESPRWLIEREYTEKAEKLVKKAAKANGRSEKLDLETNPDRYNDEEVVTMTTVVQDVEEAWTGHKGLFHPSLRSTTLILFLDWSVIGLIYYGTSYGIEELHLTDNPFLSVCIVALVEIPAYIVSALLMDVVGRKTIITFTLLLSSLSCLLAAGLSVYETHAVLVLIAKFSISACFTVTRIFTSEIYPTHIRATGLGTCKSVSCLGSIISPWVGLYLPKVMPRTGTIISLSLYGVTALVASVLSLQLADTVGFSLPDTFDDVENIKNYHKPMSKFAWSGYEPNIE